MNSVDRILIIDNYDSYTYNLFQYLGELTSLPATIVRNDEVTFEEVREMKPTRVVISPGPGNPEDPRYFGICMRVIRELGPHTPILGVCLGHQGIGAAFGGRVVRAPKVMHGKTSVIQHDGSELFALIDNPFEVMRYHSLVVDPATLPSELRATAWTSDGVLMAVQHRRFPVMGVQFHPESVGTPAGRQLLSNFLRFGQKARPVMPHPYLRSALEAQASPRAN